MNTQKLSGLSIAVAAAALFLGAPMAQAAESGSAKVGHCVGTNACKGQGSCKGQGFVALPAATCGNVGGTAG